MLKHNLIKLRWLVYKKEEDQYPYWVFIEEDKGKFVFLKAQEKWPGPGKNIFCKLEGEIKKKDLPKGEPDDSCNIFSISRFGKKLNIVLDRVRCKRCWFIFLRKEYKKKPGQFYDQVFWITQSSSISERRGSYIPYSFDESYTILIDKNERYAYNFGRIKTEKKILPAGDYALVVDDKVVAIAERKTKDNFFHEMSHLDVFRIKLEEMSKYSYRVVLFEGDYVSFVSMKNKYWKGSFVAKVLADLFAEFPNIQFIFFKGRKSANQWLYYYFKQVYARYRKSNENKFKENRIKSGVQKGVGFVGK